MIVNRGNVMAKITKKQATRVILKTLADFIREGESTINFSMLPIYLEDDLTLADCVKIATGE